MNIRNLQKKDLASVMNLLNRCRPYVLAHHEYLYWMLSDYHSKSSFVYTEKDKILGFLGALQSIEKSTAFVWQICVDPEHRRKNIACKMLQELEKLMKEGFIDNIQLTINQENSASYQLFQQFTKQSNLVMEKINTVKIGEDQENVYLIRA